MSISFSLPRDIEAALVGEFGDLGQAAKEALTIEGYRRGRLSLGYVARILGLATSIQAQEWLSHRGVPLNYDADDLDTDRQTLASLFNDGGAAPVTDRVCKKP